MRARSSPVIPVAYPPFLHDGPHHRRGHRPFGPRLDTHPLVRARRGQREAGLEVNGAHGAPVAGAAGIRVGAGMTDGRQPSLQKVGAERQDQVRPAEVVVRDGGAVEGDPVRRPQRLVGERLVSQSARSTYGGGPAVDQGVQRPRQQRGDHGNAVGVVRLDQGADALGEGALGLFPAHRLEDRLSGGGVGRAAPLRTAEAVRVVQTLQGRLPPRAQRPLVARVRRVSLDLDRSPLARPHPCAAAVRALPAYARVPGRHARDDVVRRHDVGNDGLGGHRRARGDRRGRSRAAEHLQEGAAAHGLRQGVRVGGGLTHHAIQS